MKRILLIPNSKKDAGLRVTEGVARFLADKGAVCYLDASMNTDFGGAVKTYGSLPKELDLIVVIGGDGSVIDASVIAVEKEIPVIGVNLGNLGYLAEVEADDIEVLGSFFDGEYRVEEKRLLSVEIIKKDRTERSERFAVNDIIVSHENFLGIADFSLTNSVGESLKYRADGLIISTPAGSTAYSLSAGGPIIAHDIEAITATPICPHSFFNRSIVFNSYEELKLHNSGRSALKISVDGRLFAELLPDDECVVKAAEKKLKMLTFSKNNMFSTLFGKMRRFENI